jgi:hypothetical protein
MRDLDRVDRARQSPVEPIARAETTMLIVYTELDVVGQEILDL